MGKKETISQDYPVDIETLWSNILDYNALAHSMKGALSYEGLPSGQAYEGQEVVVKLKRWGWMPLGTWTIKVTRRDDEKHILETHEFGGFIRAYRHRLELVFLDDTNTRYTDYLDVDAGLLTPIIFPMFRSMYKRRHTARLTIVAG